MQTVLSRICDVVIEAGWLAALVVTPLFFNTYTNRVFEPDKIHLLRSITLIMAVAWLIQLLDGGWRASERPGQRLGTWIRRTPLVLPTLLLIAAYLISTVFSLVPRISLLGSYVRSQGTYTFLCYVAIFLMVLSHMRSRAQANRVIHAVVLSSLPIAVYGIIQHTEVAPGVSLDPLPWGGDVTQRVAANMGNAIFVAAYLIMAVLLTLERLVDSGVALVSAEKGTIADALRAAGYLFVLAVQLIAIVFTQSRGPWLGLAAGLAVFVALGALLLLRRAAARSSNPGWLLRMQRIIGSALIAVTILGVTFLVLLNRPTGPLRVLRETPYVGRLATLLNTTEGTNAVRVLIWEGVVDMMLRPHDPIQYPDGKADPFNAIRPLIGYGPESMWVAYNRFYPPDLAHYEARNASPDRSHNETFDALVRTGFLGLAAQLLLYGSLFYYALRWLGLMQSRRGRSLFLGLLAGGAVLGIFLSWLASGDLRLAGVGLPVGFIAGLLLYVIVDLLVSPVALPEVEGEAGRRNQLLILAVFSAIVAHFVEVHFGIAIVSTLTLFWTLAGLLVVVGMGWLRETGVPAAPALESGAPSHATFPDRADRPADSLRALAASREKRPEPKADSRPGGRRRDARQRARQARLPRPEERALAPSAAIREASRAAYAASPAGQFLPYALIGALVTLVLTWNFLVNQTGAEGALAVLWDAFTTRVDKVTYQVIRSPALLIMLAFTWLVGGLIALGETFHGAQPGPGAGRSERQAARWGLKAAIYGAATGGVFLIYGLLQAGRTSISGLTGMEALERVANHVVVFDAALLLLTLALAAAIWRSDDRQRPGRAFGRMPALSLTAGALAFAGALWVIGSVNIRTVRADTYYKQGLAYESAGAWEGAIRLYREAAGLQPAEDFYYLFLGRAMLSYANSLPQGGTPILPADFTRARTDELLALVDQGLQTGNREDAFRATKAALIAAQRLNPLNTDHSANLARLSRTWAFADALGPNEPVSDVTLQQLVATRAEGVNLARLDEALAYYKQATSLSPQNAQLWDEMATVQYIKGDNEQALETVKRSLALDPVYRQTYLLQGDILLAMGDRQGALQAYRRASDLAPRDITIQNTVGVLSAQLGDTEGALATFQRVIDQQTAALQAAERGLAELNSIASAAGGYDQLAPNAVTRRDTLQGNIATYRSHLHLFYRNMAIVLRDAGRVAEALQAAQSARAFASDSERPTIDALINDLSQALPQEEGQPSP